MWLVLKLSLDGGLRAWKAVPEPSRFSHWGREEQPLEKEAALWNRAVSVFCLILMLFLSITCFIQFWCSVYNVSTFCRISLYGLCIFCLHWWLIAEVCWLHSVNADFWYINGCIDIWFILISGVHKFWFYEPVQNLFLFSVLYDFWDWLILNCHILEHAMSLIYICLAGFRATGELWLWA